VPRRYSLTFSAMAHNVFNHVNLAAPVGVLESPLFGQSTALAGGFFSSAAANRSIDLQASFSFRESGISHVVSGNSHQTLQ
jgi:hypothetical protein